MSQSAAQIRSRLPRLAPSVGESAVARARLTVVPRRRPRAPRVPFVALVSLLLVGGVVGLLLFNTSMQQASFAATALQEQASTLAAREQTLRMELDVLRNPQRIAEEAQRMGMVPATGAAYLDLRHDRVLGEPVPATRVDGVRLRPHPPAKPAVLAPRPELRTVIATGAAEHGDGAPAGQDGSSADRHTDPAHKPAHRQR